MPHASEVRQQAFPNVLVYGGIGSGKTTLFRTLPGRKFLYMFDPAGLSSIQPTDDIYYEQFVPDTVSMSVVTLKGMKDSQGGKYDPLTAYVEWEKDFENRLAKNWFNDPNVEIDGVKGGFDCLGFDSLTTLIDLLMDRILEINGRAGKNPELSDYGVAALTLARIVRNATAQNMYVFVTAHEIASQDKLMKTVSNQIMVPGQLKQKLPILFSDIYHTRADLVQGVQKYYIDTCPTEMYPTARCSLKLPPVVEVTTNNAQDVTKQGFGKILREKGIWDKP